MISLFGLVALFGLSAAGRSKKTSSINRNAERCLLEEATACRVSGDPHFVMFNKAPHDFQGDGQYYYAKPCCGVDDDEMPFAIMGKHYLWGSRSVSLLDYVTLALTDKDGDVYYAHISSEFQCYYAEDDAISELNPSLYDDNVDACIALIDEVTPIGKRFDLRVVTRTNGVVSVVLKIEDEHNVQFRMTPSRRSDVTFEGRLRLHALVIDPFEEYKCYTCGLCGNFASLDSTFESCDGGEVTVVAGWAATNAFAYDITGNTYAVGSCDLETECADDEEDYECNKGGKTIPEACEKNVYLKAKELCEEEIEKVWECCATLDDDEGGCNLVVKDCAIDSCEGVTTINELNVSSALDNLYDDATAVCEALVQDEVDIEEDLMFITSYHRAATQSIMSNYFVLAGSVMVFFLAIVCYWNKQRSEYKLLPDTAERV